MSGAVKTDPNALIPVKDDSKIPRYKQVIVMDEDGEVISDVIQRIKSKNGGHFVLSYTEKMCDFLKKTTSGSVIRVFMFIAQRQNYGTAGVFGYRCSIKYLSDVLNLNRKTVYEALDYLQHEFLVNQQRIDGQLEFMVNPEYITCGSDKTARVREWNLRWQFHNQRINDSRHRQVS